MEVVNPDNPVPKYIQISDWIKQQISTGIYAKGQKLPPEAELAEICKVNRLTLRQAIAELVSAGMLKRVKGVGSFVRSEKAHQIVSSLNRISSFKDHFDNKDADRKTIVLGKGVESANSTIAKMLNLKENDKVLMIRRLRTGNGIPYIYEENYLPYEPFKGLLTMDLSLSLYRALIEQYNIRLFRAEQKIRAINLKNSITTLFNLPEKSAGFFLENITYNESNIPVEVLFSYCRGDKYEFALELSEYLLDRDEKEK